NQVRPGLTGWAQIQSVSDLTAEEKAYYDGFYVKHMGFWMDLKCLLLTPWVICRGKGLLGR
ncbi:MAG: sugar transferase, partial [Lachnospiraceae bacterium]|nr:sugar transferase [Lachnospiraceae bacterium]